MLLVDDDLAVLEGLEAVLQNSGINNIRRIENTSRVFPFSSKQEPEMIVLDLGMPGLSGEKILERLAQEHPEIPVVIITGRSDLQTAVACMRLGAKDYLVKPVESSLFVSTVKQTIETRELQQENFSLRDSLFSKELDSIAEFAHVVTRSPNMKAVFHYVEMVAPSNRPLLITGETGVGKEMIAECFHNLSNRGGAFVPVNVAGFDDTLFSDTLFGHTKGAFTGAQLERPGLIERAKGGTLFLDEIGDLELASQVKLLRLLQESEYYPLGSDRAKKTDTRFVFATNLDLVELQEMKRFRKDLYYRLRTHHVEIPPLRERLNDLPLLLDSFLNEAALALNKKKPTIPKELLNLLATYHFPGNIRELQNLVFDSVAQHRSGVLSTKNFLRVLRNDNRSGNKKGGLVNSAPESNESGLTIDPAKPFPTLEESAKFLIHEALEKVAHNKSMAAQMLGLSRRSFQRQLDKYHF